MASEERDALMKAAGEHFPREPIPTVKEALEGVTPQQINANWDTVKTLLYGKAEIPVPQSREELSKLTASQIRALDWDHVKGLLTSSK